MSCKNERMLFSYSTEVDAGGQMFQTQIFFFFSENGVIQEEFSSAHGASGRHAGNT